MWADQSDPLSVMENTAILGAINVVAALNITRQMHTALMGEPENACTQFICCQNVTEHCFTHQAVFIV